MKPSTTAVLVSVAASLYHTIVFSQPSQTQMSQSTRAHALAKRHVKVVAHIKFRKAPEYNIGTVIGVSYMNQPHPFHYTHYA